MKNNKKPKDCCPNSLTVKFEDVPVHSDIDKLKPLGKVLWLDTKISYSKQK